MSDDWNLILVNQAISTLWLKNSDFPAYQEAGTIVGRSIRARVLLDGNKSPISVHCDYLDAILPVLKPRILQCCKDELRNYFVPPDLRRFGPLVPSS